MNNTLSNEAIENNKIEIINLLSSCITRDNANISGLIEKLSSSDFFIAPASTKFHCNYKGGLAEHSLNVYYNLKMLVETKNLGHIIPDESVVICALLHDMSKINFYEKAIRNKKVYSENGSKYDNMGNFDWVSEDYYSIKPEEERFIYGNHEETSEFMIRYYIPLYVEESIAIMTHHGGIGATSNSANIGTQFERYSLACLLHMADLMSTFVDEGRYCNE